MMKDDTVTRGWLDAHPEIRNVRCGAADLNGQARGKRVPVRVAKKIEEEGTRFPLSVLNLDIWGEDVEDSPLVFEIGDPDGVLWPTERGYLPMPWLSIPSALLPLWMYTEEGAPFDGDPRHALARNIAQGQAFGRATGELDNRQAGHADQFKFGLRVLFHRRVLVDADPRDHLLRIIRRKAQFADLADLDAIEADVAPDREPGNPLIEDDVVFDGLAFRTGQKQGYRDADHNGGEHESPDHGVMSMSFHNQIPDCLTPEAWLLIYLAHLRPSRRGRAVRRNIP